MDEIVVRLDQHRRWLSQSEGLTARALCCPKRQLR